MKEIMLIRFSAIVVTVYFLLYIYEARAVTPMTSCPEGWHAVDDSYVKIATSCSTDYVDAGTTLSCEEATQDDEYCYMYAPAGVSYTDASGTYEFTEACEMEESSSSS